MSYQSLVDFNGWTLIAQILNLFIQIYLFKRFLFKPVKKIFEQRQQEVDSLYADAEKAKQDAETAKEIMEDNKEAIGFQSVELNDQVAKVSIVGAGMANNAGVACKMFEALFSAGININMISTSEIRITVLVKKKDGEKAMNAIHDAFFGNVD